MQILNIRSLETGEVVAFVFGIDNAACSTSALPKTPA
jgi:hypothetical protein